MRSSDDEEVARVGNSVNGQRPSHGVRSTPSGRFYRIPDPGKKVISLEDGCGQLLFDAAFFLQLPTEMTPWLDGKRRLIPVVDFVRQQRLDLLDGGGFG